MRNNMKGFTLVELLVVMAMFMGVIMIASTAFERIIAISGQQMKSAESNIQGIVGLEMLRYDLDHAGYGLPYRFDKTAVTVDYVEVAGGNELLAKGMDSSAFNAVNHADIQAVAAGTCTKEVNGATVTNAGGGPDYLVVRSSVAALNDTARKWAYVSYSSVGATNLSHLKTWGNASEDFQANDRIVTIRSTYSTNGTQDKVLLMNGATFQILLPADLVLPAGANFKPQDGSDEVVAYGVLNSASTSLLMPYNRTDLYVSRVAADVPPKCNSGTGVLYKAVADHAGGFVRYPLLDCVGDMQVEFEVDPSGPANTGNTSFMPTVTGLGASGIRDQMRTIRVYILAHDGGKDKNFSYPGNSIQVGDPTRAASSGRTLSADDMSTLFGADWRNYRWKLYTIVTRAKNLSQ